MKKDIPLLLISFFAIFVGTQIAEGVLLVPQWQSMEPAAFHAYYNAFGPQIGRFFTIITIAAAAIPLGLFVYLQIYDPTSRSKRFALASAVLIFLCIGMFYFYFKGANKLFYDSIMRAEELSQSLALWSRWHWMRVLIELMSLAFLIKAFGQRNRGQHKAASLN